MKDLFFKIIATTTKVKITTVLLFYNRELKIIFFPYSTI